MGCWPSVQFSFLNLRPSIGGGLSTPTGLLSLYGALKMVFSLVSDMLKCDVFMLEIFSFSSLPRAVIPPVGFAYAIRLFDWAKDPTKKQIRGLDKLRFDLGRRAGGGIH